MFRFPKAISGEGRRLLLNHTSDRAAFHRTFKTMGPAVLPVIHVRSLEQAEKNVQTATGCGAHGVFLINHDFDREQLLPILRRIRSDNPYLWLGVNFLAVTGLDAFPILGRLQAEGCPVDAYWADDARIDETAGGDGQAEAAAIAEARSASGWKGLYFGGTAFKKQRPVASDHFAKAAELARDYMDVVTTSGIATGQAAELSKVEAFRTACADAPLAIASGITPDNVAQQAVLADAILVATGINFPGDFYTIDGERLDTLLKIARQAGRQSVQASPNARPDGERWYLERMAPNIKGEKFAWLDPSAMYVNARSFHGLLDDLVAPFTRDEIDVVAGPDAMGFVLGTALATRLGKGFLTIRKAGKMPVEADQVEFVNYTGRNQLLEMRKPAIGPGTRVLLVDQWIETGGTMEGAIALVERQGGQVAGIATVCLEENERTAKFRQNYKISSAVVSGSDIQEQCNRKTLESFKTFDPASIVPDIDE